MVSQKAIDEVKNFENGTWGNNEEGQMFRIQKYQFTKTVMMTRNVIKVKQTQTKTSTVPKRMYIIDTVTENTGIMYADYIRVWIHYRFIREDLFKGDRTVKENKKKTHLQITYDIEWVKACLMKGKIETETYNNLKKYYEVVEKELQYEEGVRARSKHVGEAVNNVSQPARKHTSRRAAPDTPTHNVTPSPLREQNPDELTLLRDRFQYRENLLTCACILLLITMVFTTLAMYKLSSTISLLNDRMSQLEQSTVIQHRHQDEFLKSLRNQPQNFDM